MSPELLVAIGTLVGAVAMAVGGLAIRLWDKWTQSATARYQLSRKERKDIIDELSDMLGELRSQLAAEKTECRESIDALEAVIVRNRELSEKEIKKLREEHMQNQFRIYRSERHIEYLHDACEQNGLKVKKWVPDDDGSKTHSPLPPEGGGS